MKSVVRKWGEFSTVGKTVYLEDVIKLIRNSFYDLAESDDVEAMIKDAEQLPEAQISSTDSIDRQMAIDALYDWERSYTWDEHCVENYDAKYIVSPSGIIEQLPSTQLERDIPKKPTEATDRAWGIPCKQAVCPTCDYYLGMVHFLGEGKKKVTYCETCGQAIDWSEWEVERD